MNGYAYHDKPMTKSQWQSVAAFVVLAALTVLAFLAVLAPTANAGTKPPLTTSPQSGTVSIVSTATPACGSVTGAGGKICLAVS